MATIPEAEVAGYLALKDIHAAMMANPDSRDMVMRAAKIARPGIVNELDTAERFAKPLREELAATNAKLTEFQKTWMAEQAARAEADRNREFENAWAAQERELRNAGYMDKAIAGIKATAAQKGIVSLLDAAAVYDRDTPAPVIESPRFGSLALMDGTATGDGQDDYMAKLFKGRGEAAGETRKQVHAALMEVRQQGRAA
jgi:Skp family chaperone for outer membrane proteins